MVVSYRQHCQEVWLLEPSTFGDLESEIERYEFQSGFDRIFFLHHFDGSVSELHVRRAA